MCRRSVYILCYSTCIPLCRYKYMNIYRYTDINIGCISPYPSLPPRYPICIFNISIYLPILIPTSISVSIPISTPIHTHTHSYLPIDAMDEEMKKFSGYMGLIRLAPTADGEPFVNSFTFDSFEHLMVFSQSQPRAELLR